MKRSSRRSFGAELVADGARFRLWAPDAPAVTLQLEGPGPPRALPMRDAGDGWYEALVPGASAGTRYRFALADGTRVPDPASRFQPEGPHGPSEIVDPDAYAWRDADWEGRRWEEIVLYELHVGTLTRGGRYRDAIAVLPELVSLGVTAIELMPLAEFPGARNWGYDGTQPCAPASAYGRPEELKQLVDAAHAHGLAVFLDVVFNHFGPEGNYLGAFASPFFTDRHRTPWGAAIDFEGPRSRAVRDYFIEAALLWLGEYHVDGLRLDAVHAIHDASRPDFLEELATRIHERFASERPVHLVLENDDNEAHRLVREPDGRPRFYTAQWNDDLHHVFHVLLTGETAGYYEDYADAPAARLGRALTSGFVYQGEASPHRGGAPRGSPSGHLPPTAFVGFLQNHDQIGNRAFGERLARLAPPEALQAAAAVLLLSPGIPLLFMGEEWGAPEPFPFFCEFGPELAEAVREGRRREFAAFPAFRDPEARARIPDPGDDATFESAILDRTHCGREPHASLLALHRELLAIRRRELVPRLAGIPGASARSEVLADCALRLAWRLGDGSTLHMLANLGPESVRNAAPERTGRLLFAWPRRDESAPDAATLAAWSVRVWLDAGPETDA